MSWQLHIFRGIARMSRYSQSRFPVDDPQAWIRSREQAHRVRWPARFPADVKTESGVLNGVRCEWFMPQQAAPGVVLLYLHGGGAVFGWDDPHRHMLARLAQRIQSRALAIDYRLAPENP